MPGGRWPEATKYPLALSQQFAVNTLWKQLARQPGLFSVNGPPGTGKTTILRDVIAAVVTERAAELAKLGTPGAAFGEKHTWKTDGRTRTVRALKPGLTGYEMVVASATNGAVENITQELPARGAIAEEWHDEATYLRDQGILVLDGEDAWGAVSAPLGNKKNRSGFTSRFWWRNSNAQAPRIEGPETADAQLGLRQALKESPLTGEEWREAVRRFRKAERLVKDLADQRQAAAQLILRDLPQAQERWVAAQKQADCLKSDIAELTRRQSEAEQALADYTIAEDRRRSRRSDHRIQRPGLWEWILTFGRRYREWLRELKTLELDLAWASDAVDQARTRLLAVREPLARLKKELAALEQQQERLHSLTAKAEEFRKTWGDLIPDPAAFTTDGDVADEQRRELFTPWADEEFTTARTRLFIEALKLHEAFLFYASRTMVANLDAAMEIVSGGAPTNLPRAAVKAAWQNLFLAVPVVSTTFASFDKLFHGLEKEDLGWLFIDEAGQAVPQLAVGALWRTQRAVIVGDPLQLEPVVTLPGAVERRLRTFHEVAEEWGPRTTSVQRIADRANPWGAYLSAPTLSDDDVWVGTPLRVHRRCDEPMFGISNAVAYDGLMVYGTPPREEFPHSRRSVWWDVCSTEADGKWIPAEGEVLEEAVSRLLAQGLDSRSLFVVSPFRQVASEARCIVSRLPGGGAIRTGTVHTTQGKEADVVIFVLGTAPSAIGARRWASKKPNLLNVAVSRAKRRLLVIGNWESWRTQQHFDVLAAGLERYSRPPLAGR